MKTYYKPLEAAILWCHLQPHEKQILKSTRPFSFPHCLHCFAPWPDLQANLGKIYDGLLNNELPFGKHGITNQTTDIEDPELSIRRIDLKKWLNDYYPLERPPFLFDELERSFYPSITVESVHLLLIERESLKVKMQHISQQVELMASECERLRNQLTEKKRFCRIKKSILILSTTY